MITSKKRVCKSAVLKIIGAHLLAFFFSFIIMSTLKNFIKNFMEEPSFSVTLKSSCTVLGVI